MPSSHKRSLGILSIGVPYFGVATATDYLTATREVLEPHYHLVGPAEMVVDPGALDAVIDEFQAAHIGALLLQIGTFPDGEAPARLADRLDVPIVVHALPEPHLDREVTLNSLCGANMTTFTLTALDRPHLFCFGDPPRPGRTAGPAGHAQRRHLALGAEGQPHRPDRLSRPGLLSLHF